MIAAARSWALALRAHDARAVHVGMFGSYARGDSGVGSDLDLVVIARDGESDCQFDVTTLPVPADVVVFGEKQWASASAEAVGIARTIAREALWLA